MIGKTNCEDKPTRQRTFVESGDHGSALATSMPSGYAAHHV